MMFGESLPYDLPTGISSFSLTSDTTTEDVTQLSIGQGSTLMTPMHLNMVTAAIANGGTIHRDQIIASVKTGTGSDLSVVKTEEYRTVMTAEVAAKMREMMRDVVLEGTATKLSSRPYNPCGKTGSAEIVTGQSTSHAWFTGFAPLENPEIAITVIVEGAGSGGVSAVPVARSVMDEYFGYTPAAGEDDDANYVMVGTDGTTTTVSDPSESTGTTVTLNMDTDGDGIMDAFDANGDGIADAYDLDGDGIPESATRTPAAASSGQAGTTTTNETETTQTTATPSAGEGTAGTTNATGAADAAAGTADVGALTGGDAAQGAAGTGTTDAAVTPAAGDAAGAAQVTGDPAAAPEQPAP